MAGGAGLLAYGGIDMMMQPESIDQQVEAAFPPPIIEPNQRGDWSEVVYSPRTGTKIIKGGDVYFEVPNTLSASAAFRPLEVTDSQRQNLEKALTYRNQLLEDSTRIDLSNPIQHRSTRDTLAFVTGFALVVTGAITQALLNRRRSNPQPSAPQMANGHA